MATPDSTSCSSAIGLSRPLAGRTCGANSLMSTPPPARQSPKKRSIALASFMLSIKSSTDYHPSGDGSGASSTQSRLPRPWPLGPRAPCASSRANLSSPRPFVICGRAGPRWCVASTTAGWRSTTIPPSGPCAVSRSVVTRILSSGRALATLGLFTTRLEARSRNRQRCSWATWIFLVVIIRGPSARQCATRPRGFCASHDPEKVKVDSILHGFGLSTTDPTPRADRRRRRRRRNRN